MPTPDANGYLFQQVPRDHSEAPSLLASLGAPFLGEVTSQRLKSVISFGRFVKVAAFNLLMAIAACVIFSVPAVWYVCTIVLLAVIYSFSPFWFYKDMEFPALTPSTSNAGFVVQEDSRTGD
jgi:hypothetical protein